jgi:cytosol alanyl aminopeptidase
MNMSTRWLPVLLMAASCAANNAEIPPPPVASAPERIIPSGQLPQNVKPISYMLSFDVVPARDRFAGHTQIEIEMLSRQDFIFFHGASLDVQEAIATTAAGKTLPAIYKQENETGLASLQFQKPIGPGKVRLSLKYTAPFDKELKGLYNVKVEKSGENPEHYAFTQFEATSARYAFPSFDEPRFKTPFQISIAVAPEDKAVTTTEEIARENRQDGLVEIQFSTTAILPTYLIAIAVGPLDIVEAEAIPSNDVRKQPVPFRGVSVKGKGAELAYALAETPAILREMEMYFNIPYPFSKLDIIAVPDFASGAMENVGAITFREWLLLVDPAVASEAQKKRFHLVMAHELAHMWFGNLVTMPWWDDIWLNEAFATWMAYKIIHQQRPEMEVNLDFLRRVQSAMQTDHLASARQIRQPIESDHDIRNAFDSITYSKGGGVLAMFEEWLGADTFRDGIRLYMQNHAFGSATADDLLAALSTASQKDVATPFRSFLFQPGVPQVSVRYACNETKELELTQRRYLPLGSLASAERTWQIPVCSILEGTDRSNPTCILLTDKTQTIPLGDACPKFIMPNAQSAGYFHWDVPPETLPPLMDMAISSASSGDSMNTMEVLGIADALMAAFQNGRLSAHIVIDAMARLAQHPHPKVAQNSIHFFQMLRDKILPPTSHDAFDGWAQKQFQPVADRLGIHGQPDESGPDRAFRGAILRFLVRHVNTPKIANSLAPYGAYFLSAAQDGPVDSPIASSLPSQPMDANWADVALAAAIQVNGSDYFQGVMESLHQTTDSVRRSQILEGLSNATDPAQAESYRQLSLDPQLRTNEVLTVLYRSFSKPENRADAWAFVQKNFVSLKNRLPTTRKGRLPKLGGFFCEESRAKEFEAFFASRVGDLQGGPRNLQLTVEKIQLCAAQIESQRSSAAGYFSDIKK